MEEYARMRFTLLCNSARRLPTIMEAIAMMLNTRKTGARSCAPER